MAATSSLSPAWLTRTQRVFGTWTGAVLGGAYGVTGSTFACVLAYFLGGETRDFVATHVLLGVATVFFVIGHVLTARSAAE